MPKQTATWHGRDGVSGNAVVRAVWALHRISDDATASWPEVTVSVPRAERSDLDQQRTSGTKGLLVFSLHFRSLCESWLLALACSAWYTIRKSWREVRGRWRVNGRG